MDAKLQELEKSVADLRGLLADRAAKDGVDDQGHAKMDAIIKDQFGKMRDDILAEMDKRLSEKKKLDIEDPAKGIIKFGDFLKQVRRSDPSLAKAMVEGTPASGGYTVPTEYDSMILGAIMDASMLPSKVTMFPQGSWKREIPKWLAGVTVYIPGEATATTASAPTLAQKESQLKAMHVLIPLSDEYIEDDISNMPQQLARIVGEAFAAKIEYYLLSGNTGGGDAFGGILFNADVKQEIQDGDALAYLDLNALWNDSDLLETYRAGAEFFMNRAAVKLIMGLVDLQMRPLWNMISIEGVPNLTLFGSRINVSAQIASTLTLNGGTGETAIVYGNPKHLITGYHTSVPGVTVEFSNQGVVRAAANDITHSLFQDAMKAYRFDLRRSCLVAVPQAFSRLIGVK